MTPEVPRNSATRTDFDEFLARYHEALKNQSQGDPAPLLSLWSRDDDVVFMAPMGGYQLGFEQVSGLLEAAAKGQRFDDRHAVNLLTIVNDDTALTAEIEHMSRKPDPTTKSEFPDELALRVTTFYRREKGEWRIVLRHANIYEELDFPLYTSHTA